MVFLREEGNQGLFFSPGFEEGAWRYYPDNVALDDPFAFLWLFKLLTNGDLIPLLN
jgi:hypothetical protein